MARKPFKTLEEQVAILESRGLSMPEYAAYALLGEDYYCVVNRYKEPFVSVNIIFTISTNAFSPISPTRIRRIRQRGCAAFGA